MKLVKISDLFSIQYGNSFELINMDEVEIDSKDHDTVNFVARTSKNHGISARVKKIENVKPFRSKILTVSVGGSVLETFLQTSPFYTGYHVLVLSPKKEMSEKELVFYAWCIRKNKYRYSYGRQANRTLKDILIPEKLPENLVKITNPEIDKSAYHQKQISLKDREWRLFEYQELFSLEIGQSIDLNKLDLDSPGVNYVSRTEENNGIVAKVKDDKTFKIYTKKCITIPMVGNAMRSSYQTQPFCVSQNIAILKIKDFEINQFIAEFLNTLIRKEIYRFSYGRKL